MGGGNAPTVIQDLNTRELAQREFVAPLVVEAGAGTGKTALLVARVAAWCMGCGWSLHAEGDREAEDVARRVIERVVAITFTEAAAAEMARKIGEAFSQLAEGEEPVGWAPDPEAVPADRDESRARADYLVAEAHRLSVSTIHSFCQRLLSTYPLEAGLHPRFAVDAEEEEIGALVEEVVEGALRALDQNPLRRDWEVLAEAGVDPPQIAEAVRYLVTNGMSVGDLDQDPFDDARAAAALRELSRAVLSFAAAESGRLDGLSKGATTSILARDLARDLVPAVQALGESPKFSELVSVVSGRSKKAFDRFKTWAVPGGFNKTEAKCLGDAEEAAQRAAFDLSENLTGIAVLRPTEFNSARRVLLPLLGEVETRRTARGIVSFSDLLFRAARLVETSPATVREVCSEIDQLLVDEFQDTDAVQCRLVENLAFGDHGRPGLFVVGDPKQSIYAWRNADLAAYQSFVATVREHGGERYPLVQNFRSVEPILEEVGLVVEEIMIEEDDVQPPFVPLLPTGDRVGARGFSGGRRTAVENWVTWPRGEDGEPPRRSKSGITTAFESDVIARDIHELVHREGVKWGDIAILLRATTAQEDLLEAFRKRGIPYEVAKEKEFYKQREVVEAAALVRCVIDPADTLALLTVLRSDVVGVPDVALSPLWEVGFPALMADLRGTDGGAIGPIDDCISRAASKTPTSPPGADLLRRWPVALRAAVRVIGELRAGFAADPPDLFVERIRTAWLAEVSAAARFLGRFRRARLDRFFSDLERRMAKGDGGVAGLARFLRQAVKDGQSGAVAGEPDLQANAVHVMTIHGAKGLDFSHVYLAQIHRESKSGETKTDPKVLPLAGGREYRIFGWPTPDFPVAEELKKRQSSAEMIRLLYVAMTRAKERLVVSGGWSAGPKGKDPLLAQRFADLLDSRIDEEALDDQLTSTEERRVEEGRYTQWFVPALGGDDEVSDSTEERSDPALKDVDAMHLDAEILAAARAAAGERMLRPLTGGASSLESRQCRRLRSRGRRTGGCGRVRSRFGKDRRHGRSRDVGGSRPEGRYCIPASRDARRSDGRTEGEARGESLAEAETRLGALVNGLVGGHCMQRLSAISDDLVGREIAIVAPPQSAVGPVGAITGFVDLVYRDPDDGRIVVADYKTDAVSSDDAVAERAHVYEPQVRTYAGALQGALALDHEPHVELWFLAADRIVRL